ncbi:MAG: hypothetical protein JXJ22_04875 [Bacteroidales bacterium]|nr:hypothetical protein [Bacteroidales bacterium]
MEKKIYLKIVIGIMTLILLIKFLTIVFVGPWVRGKIQSALNEKNIDYNVEIDKVRILMISSGIQLENITICPNQEHQGDRILNVKIASIKFKGISLVKVLFKNDVNISNVTIYNSSIIGEFPFSQEAKPLIVLPLNIRIGSILFDKIHLDIQNTASAQSYLVNRGVLKVYGLKVDKQDTLSPGIIKQFDIEAEELVVASPDSMYSYTASGIFYSATTKTLTVNSFYIHPNYTGYDFTSQYDFQMNCIEAGFNNIYVHDFNATGYLTSGSLISSYIEIGKMDMNVFRDKRKEFRHVNKPTFQDLIYNYPGTVQIDSLSLIDGNVTLSIHAEEANEPGSISFNNINCKIYKITNSTLYKTEKAFLELKGNALLMGKSKMTILLKGKIFDSHNTFFLNGTLSSLEAKELNPILEKSAFIYATSGKIDEVKFSFIANNERATGKITMLYHGLDIAVKNKRTADTTAIKERFISLIVNRKLSDSNPIPDEEVREGIIDYERDPERFLFNYCFKSILSGIKSTLIKNPKKSKN